VGFGLLLLLGVVVPPLLVPISTGIACANVVRNASHIFRGEQRLRVMVFLVVNALVATAGLVACIVLYAPSSF